MDFKNLQDVKDEMAKIVVGGNLTNSTVINASYNFTIAKGRKKTISYNLLSNYLIEHFSQEPQLVSIPRLSIKIQRLISEFTLLTKAVERNCGVINRFINDHFEFPLLDTATVPLSVSPQLPSSPPLLNSPPQTLVTTPVKTRRDCDNCSSSKKSNIKLQKVLKAEKSENNKLKSFSANIKRHLQVRVKNQRLGRQENRLKELRLEIRTLKAKLHRLQCSNKTLITKGKADAKCLLKCDTKNNKLELELASLKEKLHNFEVDNKQLRAENKHLLDLIHVETETIEENNSDSEDLISKVGKSYSSDIRQLIYYQLVCDVPVKHCGTIINKFVNVLCGQKLKHIPSPATCAQMAYELGVITTIQTIGHMVKSGKNICLSWDATTIDGMHVNEIHLTVDKTDCLVLDVRHLPGGQTSDYVSHIISALTEATDVYARYTCTSQESIFAALNITSTLTDRAAVNACVTRQLRIELDAQLIQLNCNIHPLDSVARYAKQSLIGLDKLHSVEGSCFGNEGTAVNLINAVSVLRFKDGTGDPVGFKNMLRQHNLPVGTFVRYVGNRLHVVFHLAGILVRHWSKLKDFVSMQCTAGGLLRNRLAKDLSDERIMAQVWALGVLGKIFSGPWMTKFYSSSMSNLEMRPLVQCSEGKLNAWIETPQCVMMPTMNVFGEQLSPDEDEVLSSLHNFVSGEVQFQIDALVAILKACLTVLQRQLKGFLTEDEPPSEMRDMVSSAPTHNMASERSLGCLDKMYRRAPVATGGFLSGKVRSKLNKCTQWLDSLLPHERVNVINFAIKEAREDRARKCVNEKTVNDEISKRRREVACERRNKDKKKVVKLVKKALEQKSVSDLEQCSDSIKSKIEHYIEQPECLVGLAFLLSLDGSEYYGRFCSIENNDITVSYWGVNEPESSSVDYSVSIFSFFADAILGAIIFL